MRKIQLDFCSSSEDVIEPQWETLSFRDDLDSLTLARAIHVLAIVHWIGGVSVVTTVVLPYARRKADAVSALEAFESFEVRFARQAGVSIFLAGLTGLCMLYALDAWGRFYDLSFWWLDLMVAVWAAFAAMIYVLEPLYLHEWFRQFAKADRQRAFSLTFRLHFGALAVSAAAIGAGVLGAHGG